MRGVKHGLFCERCANTELGRKQDDEGGFDRLARHGGFRADERMQEERDFDLVDPVFFTTSKPGGKGPDIGREVPALKDATFGR